MRKLVNLSLVTTLALLIVSCGGKGGGSFESDVRKMASFQCEMKKLMAEGGTDAEKKLEKLQKEMEDFSDEMEKKYKEDEGNKEMEEKADKIMDEVMEKCK